MLYLRRFIVLLCNLTQNIAKKKKARVSVHLEDVSMKK